MVTKKIITIEAGGQEFWTDHWCIPCDDRPPTDNPPGTPGTPGNPGTPVIELSDVDNLGTCSLLFHRPTGRSIILISPFLFGIKKRNFM